MVRATTLPGETAANMVMGAGPQAAGGIPPGSSGWKCDECGAPCGGLRAMVRVLCDECRRRLAPTTDERLAALENQLADVTEDLRRVKGELAKNNRRRG